MCDYDIVSLMQLRERERSAANGRRKGLGTSAADVWRRVCRTRGARANTSREKRVRRYSALVWHRRLFANTIAACVALGAAGCAGGAEGPTVVRVGGDAIGQRTVAHWSRVAERGGLFDGTSAAGTGTPKERGVAFLISSAWLVGEAARLGVAVPASAVSRAASERSTATGEAEFDESLHAAGQTRADVEREVRAELSLAAIRRSLAKRAALVSGGEIAAFYESNRRMFVISEVRDVDLIESFPSRAVAVAVVKRIGGGRRFAKKAFHEKPLRSSIAKWKIADKKVVLRAIFAARPGAVSKPMRMSGRWIVFVVRRIVPPSLEPLAQVRGEIVRLLIARRRKQIGAQFEREYKARWTARTSCRPGYVVQGCAQYSGPVASVENEFASG